MFWYDSALLKVHFKCRQAVLLWTAFLCRMTIHGETALLAQDSPPIKQQNRENRGSVVCLLHTRIAAREGCDAAFSRICPRNPAPLAVPE